MSWNLYLDDERNTPNDGKQWLLARNTKDAIGLCTALGIPDFISFDHDLGGADNAMVFLKWMADNYEKPPFKNYMVHSQNPIGVQNIISFIESWNK